MSVLSEVGVSGQLSVLRDRGAAHHSGCLTLCRGAPSALDLFPLLAGSFYLEHIKVSAI